MVSFVVVVYGDTYPPKLFQRPASNHSSSVYKIRVKEVLEQKATNTNVDLLIF